MKSDSIKKDGRIPFTQISNRLIYDTRLRLQDIGLFVFMWSKPQDYKFTASSIAKQVNNGRDAVKSSLKILQKNGWLSYQKHSDGTGTWTLHLDPKAENPPQENKPKAEKPQVENPPVLIISNNNNIKNGTINSTTKKNDFEHEEIFVSWWNLYDKKVDKKKTRAYWHRHVKIGNTAQIMNHTKSYVLAQPEKQFRKDPYSYLYNEAWQNEIIPRKLAIKAEKKANSADDYLNQFLNNEQTKH